jgi:hypothetical protein
MRFFLLAEGMAAIVAAVSAYLWGYLDGRADVRNVWKKTLHEMRDFE